jgi:hypothetical protein
MLKMAKALNILILLTLSTGLVHAQVSLFSEDFETSPVTSLLNSGESELGEGPSPCGYATRGNASDFNSASVDMMSAGNASYYLGVNPESPCGGYYDASVSGSLDFSYMDSIRISFSYYKTSTLGWGGSILSLEFNDGSTSFTLSESLSVEDSWTSFDTVVTADLYGSNPVDFTITMGGGEAVAVDDIQIDGWEYSGYENVYATSVVTLYPNPAKDMLNIKVPESGSMQIMNAIGKSVLDSPVSPGKNRIDISKLHTGIYYIMVKQAGAKRYTRKLLVQ